MRALELFAGIGGFAAAVDGLAQVVCAVDHDPYAHAAYTHSWPHAARRWNVVGIKPRQLAALGADLWWMSPPCQPFTVRGERRDLDDPRAAPLVAALALVEAVRPRALGFENVATFAGSRAHALLRETLDRAGYHTIERELCPGQLGVPNKRPRFYVVASLEPLPQPRPVVRSPTPLATYLDPDPSPDLYVPADLLARYADALAVVDLDEPDPQTHVFTGAYGTSPVYAGSYLRDRAGLRWFSPEEVLRLLGFPPNVRFPVEIPRARRYRLTGNSLSVPAVREVLRPLFPVDAYSA